MKKNVAITVVISLLSIAVFGGIFMLVAFGAIELRTGAIAVNAIAATVFASSGILVCMKNKKESKDLAISSIVNKEVSPHFDVVIWFVLALMSIIVVALELLDISF